MNLHLRGTDKGGGGYSNQPEHHDGSTSRCDKRGEVRKKNSRVKCSVRFPFPLSWGVCSYATGVMRHMLRVVRVNACFLEILFEGNYQPCVVG